MLAKTPHLRNVLIFVAALFACAVGASTAHAVSTSAMTTVRGKKLLLSAEFFNRDGDTVQLAGNVQLTIDGESVRCNRAIINRKNETVLAEGNLVIASQTAYVEGSRAELSLADNTGIIYDGFVKSGQVLFEGKVIRKTGPLEYEAEKATYTACTTCPPAWRFSGSTIKAEIGGYADIKSAWLLVGDLKVFWLPLLIVPLKSERQTGLLIPSFDFEGDEVALSLPFFWAISRSQDATFQAKYYSRRGFKGLANYRYVLNEESQGELNAAALLSDQVFANDDQLPSRPGAERSNRWFISHDHIYSLPGGFINRARLNFVSDLRYPRDFRDEMMGFGDSALENRVSLTKNFERSHSSIDVGYYINQLKSDPLEGNSDSVHRFPEIRQSGVDRALFDSRVFLHWDFNYVNFAREDFAFDDVATGSGTTPKVIDRTRGAGGPNSGSFQPGTDQIRTGQRLDLKPELSSPFRLGVFEVLPTMQFRHTQYSFNVTPPAGSAFEVLPNRQYIRGRLALRTQLSNIYDLESPDDESELGPASESRKPATEGDPANAAEMPAAPPVGIFSALQAPTPLKRRERMRHEIEPEISIAGIPWQSQIDSPFFGDNTKIPVFLEGQPVSNADFYSTRGLQFDYNDRVTQRNAIAFSINNNFVKKSWNGDKPVFRQIISIKNGTSYDIDEANRDPGPGKRTFPLSDLFTIVDLRFDHFDTNSSVRYYPFHQVANTSSRLRVRDNSGNFVQLSFAQTHLITENVDEASNHEENVGFTLGAAQRYVTLSTSFNYLPSNNWSVQSWSANLDFRPPGDCWGMRVKLSQSIGEGKVFYNFAFDYNFGGAT